MSPIPNPEQDTQQAGRAFVLRLWPTPATDPAPGGHARWRGRLMQVGEDPEPRYFDDLPALVTLLQSMLNDA